MCELFHSGREFPLVGRTWRSDLTQTEKEWGMLTLVNIDLLLPRMLSALWWEIRRHLHVILSQQGKLPLFTFLQWCLLLIAIIVVVWLRPLSVFCMLGALFYGFWAQRLSVLCRFIHLCSSCVHELNLLLSFWYCCVSRWDPHIGRISRDSPPYSDIIFPFSLHSLTQKHTDGYSSFIPTQPQKLVSGRIWTCVTITLSHLSHCGWFPWRL